MIEGKVAIKLFLMKFFKFFFFRKRLYKWKDKRGVMKAKKLTGYGMSLLEGCAQRKILLKHLISYSILKFLSFQFLVKTQVLLAYCSVVFWEQNIERSFSELQTNSLFCPLVLLTKNPEIELPDYPIFHNYSNFIQFLSKIWFTFFVSLKYHNVGVA